MVIFLKLWIEAPPSLPRSPSHYMLGCEGPPTCKRWKHPSTPQSQPPKTLHSHPQDHALSTRSRTTNNETSVHWEINVFNIDLMDCMVLTAKVTKITETGFVLLWLKSEKTIRSKWPTHTQDVNLHASPSVFPHEAQTICKHLKLWYACWWMSMSHSHHKTKTEIHSNVTSQPRFYTFRKFQCVNPVMLHYSWLP